MIPAPPRRLAVCADDFGIDAGASEAILDLMAAQRLHSTSVLVFGAASAQYSPRLREQLSPNQTLGLHFTLTEATPEGTVSSLPRVVLRSYLGLYSPSQVCATLERQLDRFESLFGAAPSFVDGHEHVHQLPGVREAVVDTVFRRYGARAALRCTRPQRSRGFKALVVSALGGSGLQTLAKKRGIGVNSDFAGVYTLRKPGIYRQHMLRWLDAVADGGLLMCHPGKDVGETWLSAARHEEYLYLTSAQWLEDLAAHGIKTIAFRSAM